MTKKHAPEKPKRPHDLSVQNQMAIKDRTGPDHRFGGDIFPPYE